MSLKYEPYMSQIRSTAERQMRQVAMKAPREVRIPAEAKGIDVGARERKFCIDNLLFRIHFIIVMISWTGLVPGDFEFPFPGSLTSTFL